MRSSRRKQTEYLWDRSGSPHVWFSRAVPKRLWDVEGKKVIQCSLGTSDRAEARQRARRCSDELEARWKMVPSGPGHVSLADTPKALKEVAVEIGYDKFSEMLLKWRAKWPDDDEGYSARLKTREIELQRLARKINDGDLTTWEKIADRNIASRSIDVTKGSSEYGQFVRWIGEATIDALGVFNRLNLGAIEAEPRSIVVRDVKAVTKLRAKSGETILELFDAYANEKVATKQKRPAGVEQDRMVISRFAEFVGQERAMHSVGFDHPRSPPHRKQAYPASYPARLHHCMVMLETSASSRRQTCSSQVKNATVVLGSIHWIGWPKGG